MNFLFAIGRYFRFGKKFNGLNMQNYITAKTKDIFISKLNSLNLVALAVFFLYFFSITLLPVGNSIVSVRQSNLATSQNKNNSFYLQAAKAGANTATEITTTTYINNGLMLARQIDNNNLQSYINDAKGSVLKLNSLDKSQDQIYNYDAYGKPIANTIKPNPVLNVLNPFQYNGERFDNNTALQYLRARFYNPEIKRFVNQDSYSLLNRFAYVDANPVMITDPTGHNAFNPFSAAWWSDNWNNGLLGKLTVIGVAAAGAAAAGALVAGGAYFGRRKSSSRASLLRADANESISAEAPSSGGISANIVEQSDFVSVLARNNSKFTKVEDFKEVNEVNFAQSLYLTPDGKGPPPWDVKRNGSVTEVKYNSLSESDQRTVTMLRSIEWGVFEYKRIPVTGRLEKIGKQLNIIRNKIDKIKREVGGLPKNNRRYIKGDKEIERMIVERKGLVAEQESLGQCRAELEISRTNKEYKKIAIDIANKYGLFDENHPGSDTAIDIFNELGS